MQKLSFIPNHQLLDDSLESSIILKLSSLLISQLDNNESHSDTLLEQGAVGRLLVTKLKSLVAKDEFSVAFLADGLLW